MVGLIDFSITLGCEASATTGFGGGRRIASRPFLHSGLGAAPFIDQSDDAWLYNYGWDWRIDNVNNIYDSSTVQSNPGSDNGYFGGGYTIEAGTTHAIQREIPVLPSFSIAAMSHAHLGGFSIAYATIWGDEDNDPSTYTLGHKESVNGIRRFSQPFGVDFQKTIANGMGGLAPHVTQAIGNSYAHPNIPAADAFTTKTRHFDADESEIPDIPFVDHSYLANKALWDDYFFSSIAPQPEKVPLFEAADRTAEQVAEDFFFGDKALPNRRIKPYMGDLDEDGLTALFTEADTYTDGLADKIAAHLLLDGAFNINSTSVEAWTVLLTSLRGKPMAYINSGTSPSEVSPLGSVVGFGVLPNTEPITTAEITSQNAPTEQWLTNRELTDEEITELAEAIASQVRLRGPFLSLSEFINRRLDASNTDAMAEKGALQAALDDAAVSINAHFWDSDNNRLLDDEVSGIAFDFPAAAEGPIAYGSLPYIDQADILRQFASQLTPRGDTFLIRAYGDALDVRGEVAARAWCEAVVQRVPEYIDPTADEPHEKQADLSSPNNQFGRQYKIISFRWLNESEI